MTAKEHNAFPFGRYTLPAATERCAARKEDGTVCGLPAPHADPERGHVCADHLNLTMKSAKGTKEP